MSQNEVFRESRHNLTITKNDYFNLFSCPKLNHKREEGNDQELIQSSTTPDLRKVTKTQETQYTNPVNLYFAILIT